MIYKFGCGDGGRGTGIKDLIGQKQYKRGWRKR